jgi:general secretion pathway protein J
MPRSRLRADGFALVEALASLVIVSMIVLMLFEGVATGRRVWERMGARDAAGEAVDGAEDALRGRIEQMFPGDLYDGGAPYVDFDGAPHALALLAPPPEADRPAPLRRYRLILTAAGDLVVTSAKRFEPQPGAAAAPQVLVRRVQELDLAYFGAAGPDRTRQWWSSWRRQPTPPQLVRVRLVFQPGDRRKWPDLIVAPRATVDADCALSPLSHDCQNHS